MSHLDEGHLHALLDGELDEEERRIAEAHIAECAECRQLFDEARTFLAQADELIAEIQLPRAARGPVAAAPEPPRRTRRVPWNALGWAATLVLATGLGWYASEFRYRTIAALPDSAPRPAATAPATDSALRPTPARSAEAAPEGKPVRQERRRADAAAGSTPAAPAPVPPAAAPAQAQALSDAGAAAPAAVGTVRANLPAPNRPAASLAEAPAEAGKVAGENGLVASQERDQLQPSGLAASRKAVAPALRRVDLATAVRMLGGTIRLVDGLTPTAVLVGPGSAVPGADPEADIVRVVYEDPPARELWLDQQRSAGREEADRRAGNATTLLLGDTLVAPAEGGARSLRWLDQSGFRLGLTGFLPADSLLALARHVQ